MKKRIRVGNDFDISWSIKRGGVVEDLTLAVDKKLEMVVYSKTVDISNFTIVGGTLLINVPRELVTTLGDYRLIFEYTLPDARQPDGNLRCKTDVIPFRIVATTAEADVIATIGVASDVAIGFRGDKGLQGDDAYQVWLDAGNVGTLDDYLAWQRQPAIDAGNTVVDQTVLFLNERAAALEDRVNLFFEDVQTTTITPIEQAEIARANAEGDATKGRVKAENERVTAEGLRDETEGLRELAELARANAEGDATKGRVKAENDRVAAEILRNETFDQKMGEADDKIEEMNTTLSTYDNRVSQVESDIDQLADDVEGTIEMPIAHALSQLKEEVDSLRMLIEEGRINKLQIETLDVISEIRINGSPLIYVRDSAPSFSPDQVPQFYIDTSAGRLYTAKGAGSANDWF